VVGLPPQLGMRKIKRGGISPPLSEQVLF